MKFDYVNIKSEIDIPYLKVLEELTHQYLLSEHQFNNLLHYIEYSHINDEIKRLVRAIYFLKDELEEGKYKSEKWKTSGEIMKYMTEQQLLRAIQSLLANDAFFIHSL